MDALEIMNVSSGTSKTNLHFPLLSGRKFETSTFKDSFLRNTYEKPKANNSGRLIAAGVLTEVGLCSFRTQGSFSDQGSFLLVKTCQNVFCFTSLI